MLGTATFPFAHASASRVSATRPPHRNEQSWLLAQKELQKINQYKAPRDKLVCLLNCCRVLNNMLNVTVPPGEAPPGADDFLPVLVYVLLRAQPLQLGSNLAYITRFRLAGRLVSETAYFFTNLVSAAVRVLRMVKGRQCRAGR